ncbi:MAG TPA: TIGR00266 family protein [Bacteroidetes bacterium]|nr:TIGR00266 family protein [Bacteroidota bacterium]HRK04673.1 TIGR00266 family protein [Chlorobiota bacterium]
MNFTIEHGPVYASLRVDMNQGERFRAEPGAMLSMSQSIELETTSAGKGLFGTLKAAVGGESIFASIFTAVHGPGELLLAPSTPGDIMRLDLTGETILAYGGAYLAGDPDLSLSARGSLKGLVAGSDLFLSVISGRGPLFLNGFGAIYSRTLRPGEGYIVDTGHIVAFTDGMHYSIKTASRGLFSSFASGEGLVCLFTGPGTLWMQTRNVRHFAQSLIPFLPSRG